MSTIKKHSKFKNTGILFELLVRQVTSDMITNRDSKAIRIIKKYFSTDSELLREYNLYNTILKAPITTEAKAEGLINTVILESKKLDTDLLNKEKYALIKEIKKHYDIENFFKAKINNYKTSAAIYTLFEASRLKATIPPSVLLTHRATILEHITKEPINRISEEQKAANEFIKEDKDIRILAYKLIVEKYNETYANLNEDQKEILKEYINNVSDTKQLKEYLNTKITQVRKELSEQALKVDDKVVKIKLKEVISLVKPLTERQAIKDEHLISLMQYYELVKELKTSK